MKNYAPQDKTSSVLEEPAVAYDRTNYYTLASQDISKKYIKQILAMTKLTLAELMEIIPISIDTYKRKNAFNSFVTEKILEIEEVYRTGLGAFGEGFYEWMSTENIALGGIKPKLMLSNSFGVRRLLDQIGRMQHGVLA